MLQGEALAWRVWCQEWLGRKQHQRDGAGRKSPPGAGLPTHRGLQLQVTVHKTPSLWLASKVLLRDIRNQRAGVMGSEAWWPPGSMTARAGEAVPGRVLQGTS